MIERGFRGRNLEKQTRVLDLEEKERDFGSVNGAGGWNSSGEAREVIGLKEDKGGERNSREKLERGERK